jgi:molybdate transport system permease protein
VDGTAVLLSLRIAACTTALLLAGGLPLAYWLARTPWRGKHFVEALFALPLVLPPTVLGFYLLLALGPRGMLGQGWYAVMGRTLPFSFTGILIGSVVFNLPFAVGPFSAAFARIDRQWIEASQTLGMSRLGTFRSLELPLAAVGVLTGCVLAFAHAVGEFGVVLMLGGNIPGRTRTLSIALYDHVQALDYAAAGQEAAALVLFSFAVLACVYRLQRHLLPD